jgi:hypothetical protein
MSFSIPRRKALRVAQEDQSLIPDHFSKWSLILKRFEMKPYFLENVATVEEPSQETALIQDC